VLCARAVGTVAESQDRPGLLNEQQLAEFAVSAFRDVVSCGEVTAALNEPSARQCCHNVAGAETSGEPKVLAKQGGCT
jgi:hypothetical protein